MQMENEIDSHLVEEEAAATYEGRQSPFLVAAVAEASYGEHRMPFRGAGQRVTLAD
jgi:hypothetical protein